MSAYKWDVFLSYSHEAAVGQWVENHFHDLLEEFLGPELDREAKVFWDRKGLEPGQRWPDELRDALRHSRCLIAIWTPRYRTREWCQIEWQTMCAREEHLRARGKSAKLVVPILYSDGDEFRGSAAERPITSLDFKKYAYHRPVFQKTKEFHKFNVAVKGLAGLLKERIRDVPPWEPSWPLVEKPDMPPERAVELQRL